MNRKILKILTVIIYIFFIISMISNIYATTNGGGISSSFTGSTDVVSDAISPAKTILSSILLIIRNIGAFIAVAILMVIACKYIIASAGDRADAKKYAINYIIGALILFGASGIITLAKKFIDSSLSTE